MVDTIKVVLHERHKNIYERGQMIDKYNLLMPTYDFHYKAFEENPIVI